MKRNHFDMTFVLFPCCNLSIQSGKHTMPTTSTALRYKYVNGMLSKNSSTRIFSPINRKNYGKFNYSNNDDNMMTNFPSNNKFILQQSNIEYQVNQATALVQVIAQLLYTELQKPFERTPDKHILLKRPKIFI